MLSANVRQPENFLGDLNAQIGSVMLAGQRIESLLADYGPDQLMAVVSEILAATERQVRQFIAGWPDGVYSGESLVDDDGFDSKLVPIRAKVTIAGDSMTIDLSESSPQVEGFINSAYANTRSLAHAAIMYLAPMDVARNEGSMRPGADHRPAGTGGQREPARARVHEHEPLRRGGSRGGVQGTGACHSRRRIGGVFPTVALRHHRLRPEDGTHVHLALLPGQGRRWCLRGL